MTENDHGKRKGERKERKKGSEKEKRDLS